MAHARRLGAIALSGGLLLLALPPLGLWPLALVALVPALYAIRDRTAIAAFGWGWILGLLGNLGGQYWAPLVLMKFGKMEPWSSLLVYGSIAAYQALVFAVWAGATRLLVNRSRVPLPFAAALSMVSATLVIPVLFPSDISILLVPFWPVTQVAELTGAAGIIFWLVLVNAAVYERLRAKWQKQPIPRRTTWFTWGIALGVVAFGLVRGGLLLRASAHAPKIRIGLIQPNFGIVTKADRAAKPPEMMQALRAASLEAERGGAELVIWPESAWPIPIDRALTADYPDGHPWQLKRGFSIPLLAGVLTLESTSESEQIFNTAWLLDRNGRGLGRYDKNFLLAFGEYVPFGERFPGWRKSVRARMTESDEFSAGSAPAVLTIGQARIAPLICYEDLIAGYVRTTSVDHPNLLVTMANDAWFGHSSAPDQHLALAALRAIENRHELIRVTSTGITARVDVLGRVRERAPLVDPPDGELGKATVLLVDAALVDGNRTLYQLLGDWFADSCLVVLLAALFLSRVFRPKWLREATSVRDGA